MLYMSLSTNINNKRANEQIFPKYCEQIYIPDEAKSCQDVPSLISNGKSVCVSHRETRQWDLLLTG